MFKKATVEVTLPDRQKLEKLERSARHLSRTDTASDEWRSIYNDLGVELRLCYEGRSVEFEGCEYASYYGQARDTLVFGIHIGDDEPTWLNALLDLEEGELPGHGESVYVVAPSRPGQRLDATLALFCGSYEQWDCEAPPPFGDEDIARLLVLMAS